MSFDYDDIAATAVELLTEFGAPVTLTRTTPGTYDTDTGTSTPAAAQNWSTFGVKLDYSQRDIDGTRIKFGDQRVYVAPDLGVVPESGDKLTLVDGSVVLVIASRPLAPAGPVVLHDVQVRG